MKKILAIACCMVSVMVLFSTTAYAQVTEAETIINRYNTATGLDKLSKSESIKRSMMEFDIESAGQKMGMTAIMDKPNNYRIIMSIAGQSMVMVIKDGKGWIKQGDTQTQPMPKQATDQFVKQADMSNNFMWTSADYVFEPLGEKSVDGRKVAGVKLTSKIKIEGQPVTSDLWFDTESGLAQFMVSRIEQGGNTIEAVTNMKDYKQFGQLKAPSKYEIDVAGNKTIVRVKKMEFGYPIEPWMFAEPE